MPPEQEPIEQVRRVVEEIHATPPQAVVAVAGAGSQALAWLLGVAGASRTLLEALVPYGRLSMIDFLGSEPAQFVSAETARLMARSAYRKAATLREDAGPVLGLSCTATIATDRFKRGEHRAHVAVWDASGCTQYNLSLFKGLRDRDGEEQLVSRLLVQALAKASGVDSILSLEVLNLVEVTRQDSLEIHRADHPDPVDLLLSGDADCVLVHPNGTMVVDEPWEGAVLPGSFRPYHQGHEKLAKAAEQILDRPVLFELSVLNVDKPPLDADDVKQRVAQFAGKAPLALTRAETFRKKAELFPSCPFVVGADTAERLVAERYYGNSRSGMLTALAEIWAAGCRFLVAGRWEDGRFMTLEEVPIPEGFSPIFDQVPESQFREDVSSTALRSEP